MNDFFKEHKAYKELKETLRTLDHNLPLELTNIVADAILFGFDRAKKSVNEALKETK